MSPNDMLAVEDLVREIAQALVDDSAAVQVESAKLDGATLLRLRVAPQEVGRVIGKQGRIALAVRTILIAVSAKLRHTYTLDIVDSADLDHAIEGDPAEGWAGQRTPSR